MSIEGVNVEEEVKIVIDGVDKEQIYQHIRAMEGPRFPLDNMDKLDEASEYIREKLEFYGAKVIIHEFTVDGISETHSLILAKNSYIFEKMCHLSTLSLYFWG